MNVEILTTALATLGVILLVLGTYYYYVKMSLKDKVRAFIRDENKKVFPHAVKLHQGAFKVGVTTYNWDYKISTEETPLQIIPGIYEWLKTGYYLEGNPNPQPFDKGLGAGVIGGEELTKIVESQAIKKFLEGFGGVDNEVLLKMIFISAGIILLAIGAATHYMKPFA